MVWGMIVLINHGLGEVVYPTSSMPYSVASLYPMPSLRSTWGFLLHRAFGTCIQGLIDNLLRGHGASVPVFSPRCGYAATVGFTTNAVYDSNLFVRIFACHMPDDGAWCLLR